MLSIAGKSLGLFTIVVSPTIATIIETTPQHRRPEQQIVIVDKSPNVIKQIKSTDINTIPFSEYASLVSTALGLGKSDIARILGISRPTLYSWIKGDSEPRDNDHPERLRLLGELTRQICKDTARPLYHRYVVDPLPNQTNSIFSLLQTEHWDEAKLSKLLTEARQLTTERDSRLGHDRPVNISKAKQENNLLDNGIALNLG